MKNSAIYYTNGDFHGHHKDTGGNCHYFYVGDLDYKSNRFLIHIDSAGEYRHLRTTCLVSVYKSKRAKITVLYYTPLDNNLLREICAKAVDSCR